MRRDSRAQSSSVSWRVSGRSAMTCSVGSEVPPIIFTRTSASPSASTSGSISFCSSATSAMRAPENQSSPAAGPVPGADLNV